LKFIEFISFAEFGPTVDPFLSDLRIKDLWKQDQE